MEGVPTLPRIGASGTGRKQSTDHIPEALHVGSPVVGSPIVSPDTVGSPFRQDRPSLPRYGTSGSSGSNRLSQLLSRSDSPAIPSSTNTPDRSASRRDSYHPPSLLPPAKPTYQKPDAPSPTSFSTEYTVYSPTADSLIMDQPDPSAHLLSSNLKSSGTKHLLNRLKSLKRARSGTQWRYGILRDEEAGNNGGRRLRDVEEQYEPVEYDLSGYDAMPMKHVKSGKRKDTTSMKEAIDAQRRMSEAGFAAEYERLEDKLGSGMSSIVEIPFLYRPGAETRDIEQLEQLRGNPRGLSTVDGPSRLEAQVQAEKSGEILAISEVPTDLSHLSGSTTDFETVDTRASMFTTENADSGESKTTSYYFPEDPDMPSWKPFSMRWHYISLLTVLALGLAGLQEFLCQSSIKKTKKGGGLLRFQKPGDLSVTKYFTWKYAPTLTFVIYGILWQISDFEVKRLEPFYQLSQKSGATAAESLNMDYLTFMSWLVPLRALRHKQYAVIYSSLATLVASSLVPVLQSASVTMYSPKEKGEVDDYKYIRIDPRWSRAVTSSLVFVAICGVVLLFQLRRKSGLMSDPKGIAGVAAMATRSHILGDFHGLDAAPLNKIHKQLRHRRYILHKSSLWQGEYIRKNNERIPEYGTDPRPLMLRLRAGIPYIAFMILFAIAVPIFIFVDYAHSVTQKVPFLLTAIATIVKLLWGTMNHDVRMLEPFFILSNRDAPPQTLTLDYTGTNPIWLPFKAILNKHYIVAGVGVGSVLTEILTVCVSSFSVDGQEFLPGTKGTNDKEELHDRYNTDETFRSFWVSFSLVIGILFLLVAIASIVYLRRSHKFIPRQIGTIASVLAFIHQSKMLVAFVDTEKMDSSAMTRHLEQQHPPKKYALGWFSGRDGEDHLGIDEEPILDRYVYGEDWTKTRVLPSQIGTWEHY